MKLLMGQVRQHLVKIHQGGGKKAIEKAEAKGKMAPRQRIK